MESETRVIECAVPEISLDIGRGNRLILFKGDKVTVSEGTSVRKQYRVIDSSGHVIGYLTNRGIHYITNNPIRKGKKNVTLAPQR